MKLQLLAFINGIPPFVLVSVLIVLILLLFRKQFFWHGLQLGAIGKMRNGRSMHSNCYHNQSKYSFSVNIINSHLMFSG